MQVKFLGRMAEWEETSWHLAVGQSGPLLPSGPACLLLHGSNSQCASSLYQTESNRIGSDWIELDPSSPCCRDRIIFSFNSFLFVAQIRTLITNLHHKFTHPKYMLPHNVPNGPIPFCIIDLPRL